MPELPSRSRLAVGLISGTSMDGVDAALVELCGAANRPRVRLRAFITFAYPERVRAQLLEIAGQEKTTAGEISQLSFLLGHIFGEAARRVMKQGRAAANRVSVIGSHGQTIYHQGSAAPSIGRRDLAPSNTLQIAEPAIIAETTGVPVVANFRAADMAAGGQGAPLVPMVDYLLLRDPRAGVVALNIGGIANFTVIPARAKPNDVFGFDTGPGNMVMDGLIRSRTRGRTRFDRDGLIARRGRIVMFLLEGALRHPFFQKHPPKSAGREQFGEEFLRDYFHLGKRARMQDLLATATELTARSVADSVRRFALPRAEASRLVVSGGGAHNTFLLDRLRALLPDFHLALSDEFGLPVDAKEAMAFAVLADRAIHGLAGNLPSVTGARRGVVLGAISHPGRCRAG